MCRTEAHYRVRLRAAQMLGSGGAVALTTLLPEIRQASSCRVKLEKASAVTPLNQPDIRKGSLHGWILPLLAATIDETDGAHICSVLGDWSDAPTRGLHLGVEACLAQGLKFEANRRPERRDRTPVATRNLLIERAVELLDSSDWWYSQISLVQALALWSLDPEVERDDLAELIADEATPGKHPLVREAADLCLDALDPSGDSRDKSDPPSRYLWIDEAGIGTKVGPTRLLPDGELWVPAAAGWLALEPRARQLVADVLLFLNLIEGPHDLSTEEREKRREAVFGHRRRLPTCVAQARGRIAMQSQDTDSGMVCTDLCGLDLCAHPVWPSSPFRGELSETFCREQTRLLSRREANVPTWVEYGSLAVLPARKSRRALERFWKAMEVRDTTRSGR